MTQQVYGIGYWGRDPDEIDRLAKELGAVIFDVRYSTRSRNPDWSGKHLLERFGDRWQQVRSFGNKNYKGGPIAIVDYEDGVRRLLESPRPVILMCVCKHPAKCHRTYIGDMLRDAGFDYTELNAGRPSLDPAARRARQLRFSDL